MQATDGVIRRVAELGTGVQFGQYDLHAGQAGFRFLVHRDASAIVRDFHGTVGVQGDHNVVAEAGQGLVHGVVDDLPQAVHKPLRVGGADVHARTHADGLEAFKDLDLLGAVIGVNGRDLCTRFIAVDLNARGIETARSLAPYSSLGIQSIFLFKCLAPSRRGAR